MQEGKISASKRSNSELPCRVRACKYGLGTHISGMSHWRMGEEECLTREAFSNPSALPVLKEVVWRLLHDLEVTCIDQSQTSFPSVKYTGKRHPEFTLQWCGTHGALSSSCEHRCVCRGGAFTPAAFSTLILCKIPWWVGCSLLGRGRSEKSKQLSFKLNLHYIAGLNTQVVFKCNCSRDLCLISYLVLLLLFLPSWALCLMCVWFIPSSYLYKEQFYWGMGNHQDTQPLGLPRQPGTIHVISCERKRVPRVMTNLCPHQHCTCVELCVLISSEPWEIPQGHMLRCSEQIQPQWFPDQRPNKWDLKPMHLLTASVSKQLIKSSGACQCLCRAILLKEGRAGRGRHSLNLWGKRICCK